MIKKYEKEPNKYSEDGKKIQDLFGVRIILYFPDDLFIAQKHWRNYSKLNLKP
nr:hypothetical protein [Escherichia coli]